MDKTKGQELFEKLSYTPLNTCAELSDKELKKVDDWCEGYKAYLDSSKTEREAVDSAVELLEKDGFVEFDRSKKYKAGDRVYYNNRGKSLVIATIGTEPIEKGTRVVVAHVDSPRMDLKPVPLYESDELALFKTHYYGGIKKYQWTAIPLSLHGVIVKKDLSTVTVKIGEDDSDPVFVVTDLLPHLGKEQGKRTLDEGIKGEELNVLVGSRPFKDDKVSEKVKLNVLNILFEKYGIIESDFLSAELEVVPAFKARDIGFDRSLIGAYGHDDRVCAYPAIAAALEVKNPRFTSVTILADKEEIGSDGNTGMNSAFFKFFIADLAASQGVDPWVVLSNSQCLSADVNAAFDPTFPDVMEKKNASFINRGVVITKYTGHRGKGGSSDASAEFMGRIRKLLDDNNVIWQIGELGKVDMGGGGTVAKYVANQNLDVVDLGVPVLSMHAPFEVISKTDVYMAYRAFECFLKD